ncbi:MAG: hypothetical protein ABIH92_00120, partial [Nanoarchaeota archaeon]
MGILGLSPEEEKKEIIQDVFGLYNELSGKNYPELAKSSSAFMREYKNILSKLERYFQRDIVNKVPDFIYELLEAIEFKDLYAGIANGETEVRTIELGLKKIMNKFSLEVPRKSQESNQQSNTSPQIVFSPKMIQTSNQEVTVENSAEVNVSFNEIYESIKKRNPENKEEIEKEVQKIEKEVKKTTPNRDIISTSLKFLKQNAGWLVPTVIQAIGKAF